MPTAVNSINCYSKRKRQAVSLHFISEVAFIETLLEFNRSTSNDTVIADSQTINPKGLCQLDEN